ncbi:unnamed protein product [Coffea canephora]|uniref:Uncharacterized protein n=1 Tax=Coffea canephora TaxID=49390 RepID=A0A068TWW3_COFCA|nr:unnamed protein product [Coffea canephora]
MQLILYLALLFYKLVCELRIEKKRRERLSYERKKRIRALFFPFFSFFFELQKTPLFPLASPLFFLPFRCLAHRPFLLLKLTAESLYRLFLFLKP